MYTKYHTEGIILKSFARGEADRVFLLFTRDFGMLYAKANGVRKSGAKQAHALQELSHITVSLVRARESWRITNVEPQAGFFTDSLNKTAIKNILMLLKAFVQGEESNKKLYHSVKEGLYCLSGRRGEISEYKYVETLVVLRILHHLGYLGGTRMFGYVLASPYINDMFVNETKRLHDRAVREINRALNAADM